jgi:hypothetical protein
MPIEQRTTKAGEVSIVEVTRHSLKRAEVDPGMLELSWFMNHRRHPRKTARFRLDDDMTISDPDGKTQWSAKLLNVSASGIGASCNRKLIVDETYGVRFPLDFQSKAQMVTARMTVVYCVQQGDRDSYRVGFRLLRPKP